MKNKCYSIGKVSEETGLSIKRIRYLQEKGFLKDNRVICGEIAYRQFSDKDVDKIRKIKKYQDEGYTLNKAVEKADEEINTNRKELKNERLQTI